MKNFFTVLIFIFFSLTLSAQTQEKNYILEVELLSGVRNGVLSEYVYANSSVNGKQYYLSLLDWDIKNTFYTGLGVKWQYKNFSISGQYKGFFKNSNSGILEDSDWLQDKYYGTGNTGVKTNFSFHDCTVNTGSIFNLETKYEFKIQPFFSILPIIGFSYENFSLSASNGKIYYGNDKYNTPSGAAGFLGNYHAYNDTGHNTVASLSGKMIDLKRKDYYTWLGVQFKFNTLDERWIFSLSVYGSPFTYLDSIDDHIDRKVEFNDIGAAIFYAWKGESFVIFRADNNFSFKFSVDALYTGEIQGLDFSRNYSSNPNAEFKKTGTTTGSSSRYFDIQLSVICTF